MVINHNMSAMYSNRTLGVTNSNIQKDMEKLSSGMRINRAGDDASGLAVSEKMRAQIRGMEQADRNVQDGISMVQTAEGGLEEAGNIAQRMRELAVQGGNDTLSSADRGKIKGEMDQLQKEMQNIAEETSFNGNKLLDGSNTAGFKIQAGANDEVRTIKTADLSSIAKSLSNLDVTNNTSAQDSIKTIDAALEGINSARAELGAMQNRLDYTSSNLNTSDENLTALFFYRIISREYKGRI